MRTMRFKKLIVGVSILAAPAFAMAQSAEQLIQKYTALVGQGLSDAAQAQANAKALVNGLRDGTKITLTSTQPATTPACMPSAPPVITPPPVGLMPGMGAVFIPLPPLTVEFVPPTGKMGYGNVDNALNLAQGSLANLGIVTAPVDPSKQRSVTAEDVCIALVGGVVTKAGASFAMPGILKLRFEGSGWGEISKHPLVDTKL